MIISLIPSVNGISLPIQNILIPSVNPTEHNDGAYGSISANYLTGIGYTLPLDTNGTSGWYINTVNAYFSAGGANNRVKALIVDENKSIIAVSNIFVSENTSLLWNTFTFNVNPLMYANKTYYFGVIVDTGCAIYLHQKNGAYPNMFNFLDASNDFVNPTNPTDGTYYNTGSYAIYVTISNFASKSYSYSYEPNSINSNAGVVWSYDYLTESYGVDTYTPIGTPIVYTGNVFDAGLKTGNGTFTVYKTPQSSYSNQWQIGTYTEATNGTVINGVFTFGFNARSIVGYEGVEIIINITSPTLMNPIYTIHHSFRWGADSSGNIAPTPISGTGGTGSIDTVIPILTSIFGNVYNDVVFIIFAVICGLCTWKFALTGLVAGIGISTLICALAGLLPIWAVGLCIVLDVTIIILGSGLLNKTNRSVGN
jgi:hypothetical protein